MVNDSTHDVNIDTRSAAKSDTRGDAQSEASHTLQSDTLSEIERQLAAHMHGDQTAAAATAAAAGALAGADVSSTFSATASTVGIANGDARTLASSEDEAATVDNANELDDAIVPADNAPAAPLPPAAPAIDAKTLLLRNGHLDRWKASLHAVSQNSERALPLRACGRITRSAGLVLEATGLMLPIGANCLIELPGASHKTSAEAEVVGFHGERLFLMPTSDISGLAPGARVFPIEAAPIIGAQLNTKRLPVGMQMLGRVVDATGAPLDDLGPLNNEATASLHSATINPLRREPIRQVLDVGVRAINALLTVGRGQRMGLFAGSGVGKSMLLGMMARYTSAQVIVVGLIGERGREVKEFIEEILGAEGLARAVVVAAPADVSPLLRLQGAAYATSLAEYFRDQGLDVLLIMDSLTRYAMAQREIALAIGEAPATKGYPPSVFAKLPALVERTGNGPPGGGSITAFYTVLTEGDDQQDPIADSARAILDGHIVLSRTLAEAGHYPAIDIEASISRVMSALVSDDDFDQIRLFKQMLSRYQRNRDLINVGAYQSGRDPTLDRAISLYPKMEAFLQQRVRERCNHSEAVFQLDTLLQG